MWKLTLFSICLLLAIPCQGKIITVDDDKPADFNSIQAAIDDVNTIAGDEIVVSEGTYYENINPIGKAITIRSTNPLDPNTVLSTVIDSNGSGYCIWIKSGEDANTVIKGFLITGGGLGIYCTGSSPTITNCSISGNWSFTSGGMLCSSSSPILTNCTFIRNRAANPNSGGGGMLCSNSNPVLTNCAFMVNYAVNYGGGIYSRDNSNLTLTNCTFIGNDANTGGGIYCSGSNTTLTYCTFSGNLASSRGGGMFCGTNSSPTLTNCKFSGNQADFYGGGMCCHSGSNPALANCTFSGNSASEYGGGIYSESSNPILTDSFLCGNIISGPLAPSQIEGTFTDNGGNIINEACPPPVIKIEGDLDGDGDVDFNDFAVFANNWLAVVE